MVESFIVIGPGILFLGFAGSRWTKFFTERYLSYLASVGVKLFVLYLIMGVGMGMRSGATPSSRALFADLEEDVHDHRPHGSLAADAMEPAWNGYLLTLACSCGVVFERWVTPTEADADLLRWHPRS